MIDLLYRCYFCQFFVFLLPKTYKDWNSAKILCSVLYVLACYHPPCLLWCTWYVSHVTMWRKKSRGPFLTNNVSSARASFSNLRTFRVFIDFGDTWLYISASFSAIRLLIINFICSTNTQRWLDEFQEKETSQHVLEKVSSLAFVTRSAGKSGADKWHRLNLSTTILLTTYAIIFSNRHFQDKSVHVMNFYKTSYQKPWTILKLDPHNNSYSHMHVLLKFASLIIHTVSFKHI